MMGLRPKRPWRFIGTVIALYPLISYTFIERSIPASALITISLPSDFYWLYQPFTRNFALNDLFDPYQINSNQSLFIKPKIMYLKLLTLPAIVTFIAVFSAGCQKKMDSQHTDSDIAATMALAKSSGSLVAKVQPVVNLGLAGNFAILSKSGITDVYKSTITGDIGASPITGAAILVTCTEVAGAIYSVDAAGPLPCVVKNPSMLTTAIGNMQTAYTDAAGRPNPDFVNVGAGSIGGQTFTPGLYKWTSAVIIPADITISGGPNAVWIFQIAGTLRMSSAVKVILKGGAQAKNIYWQVASAVTMGTTSHFEGIILGQTGINLQTGASINVRMLSQTAVTLQMNTVTQP
jgi:hypothetical protein